MASWLIVARRWLLLSSHHCRGKLIRQDINFPNLSDRRLSCFRRHSDELKLIEFCSFSADKRCVIIIQILWFTLKSLFLLGSRLKKRFCLFFFFIHPNFVPYSGAPHETCMHSRSRLIPVWMKMWWGRYADMAWLGLAGMPYLCPFQPPLQGAVEDQIRMGSQIRISLIVECLRKMDGYGIEMGPRSLRDPPVL